MNWVRPAEPGQLEARYVRRNDDYVVVYLSSQTGCRQACRMCHLTATGQTATRDATAAELLEQASVVLEHYQSATARASTVHYNFMARGEPLASQVLLEQADTVLGGLADRAVALDLRPRYLVSTILPTALGQRPLEDVFVRYHPELYYSIYSMDPAFRRRWLPKALPAPEALDRLVAWQRHTYKIVKIHYAFIEGHNDDEASVHAVCDAIEERGLYVHVNVVRYNPPSERHGTEPAEAVLQRNAQIFRQRLRAARVRIIERVGFDVAASCGMFVGP
ncbi:MAG: hypothetical protein KTR31_19785 [Myxococcales bacterium]|nr:hypothetical protein [Myxococcales bacterium]